jgi:acyl-CoA synthetase (AMP-forming)/AMP-acid ligase II
LQWSTVDDIDDSLAAQWRPSAIRGDTLVFLQYTSGSTAKPKGVMVNHSNLVYNLHMLEAAFDLTDQTSIVSWLPLFHDMGLIGNVFNTLNVGTTCVLMEPTAFLYKPIRWLQAISRHRAYFSGAPNFAYDLCARKVTPEQREALDLNSWQAAFNGAEPVRHATLERFVSAFEPCGFRRQVFRPCYGLAEATLFVSSGPMATRPVYHDFEKKALEQDRAAPASGADDAAVTLVGCGQTWLDQKIVIVDPENLTRLPPGSIGEIWLSGPNVAQGYWNKPEETERTFGAYLADTGEGPFLRTGDLGFLQDGELFITGRVKDLIIIGGRNLYPQDIELLVEQSHPALRPGCSAAFSVDLDDGERLVIAVEVHRSYRASSRQEGAGITSTPDGNGGLDTKAVFKTIQQAVAEQHEVRVHDLVLLKHGGIPKTSSGKIQRHACKAGYLNGDLCMWGD